MIYTNLNKLTSELLKSIRNTGSNNLNRYVLIPTYGTLITKEALENLEIPQDDHIAISVHGYIEHDYCRQLDTVFTDEIKENIRYKLELIGNFSKENNVPAIITELAAVDKADREEWVKNMYYYAAKNNIPAIWWDNGSYYEIFNRNELKATDQETIDTLKTYYYLTKNVDSGKNVIDDINYTNNVEYNEGNMGIKKVNGRNRYFVNMNVAANTGVRFKFSDIYELSDQKVYKFSCRIKTNMNSLKIRYVLNFYDKNDKLIYSKNYSDITKGLVDGTKEEYLFEELMLVDGAYKVQLERLNVSPFETAVAQDINFELYDISLKCAE